MLLIATVRPRWLAGIFWARDKARLQLLAGVPVTVTTSDTNIQTCRRDPGHVSGAMGVSPAWRMKPIPRGTSRVFVKDAICETSHNTTVQ